MLQESQWPSEFRAAASLLLKAANFAECLQRSAWDFAIEITELNNLGLSRTDLRWLLCQGLIEHAEEVQGVSRDGRLFQPTNPLALSGCTCFVLTRAGRCAVSRFAVEKNGCKQIAKYARTMSDGGTFNRNSATSADLQFPKPLWNPELNRLVLGELLVKQYRRPAPNQQLILCAFQEEDWPERIDDPLPPASDIEPHRRLHETVAGLNRHQTNPVLRFSGDGRGRGIIWSSVL